MLQHEHQSAVASLYVGGYEYDCFPKCHCMRAKDYSMLRFFETRTNKN